MIKIFRKIRKNLLAENKTEIYLKYALGEIILVVIGILIALQINNWNEGRKLAQQESLYLKRILADNHRDLISFSKFIKDLEQGNQSVELFSEALKNEASSDSMLINSASEYFKYGSIFPIFFSSKSTFLDLSSTGNLSVIKNNKLRDKIVNHYAQHEQMEDRIQVSTDWTLPLDGPFTLDNSIMKFEPTTAFLFPDAAPGFLAGELRQNKLAFINNAAAHYWINKDAISKFEELIDLTNVLIQELEIELEGNVN